MALGWKWLVVLPLLLASNMAAPAVSSAAVAKPWIGVNGNHLVDGEGKVVRLLGVNRSSAEYSCVEEGRIFEGPTDWASIKAMKSWKINAVRLPLNESCWLGTGAEVDPRLSGSPYRSAIHEYVAGLERAGLYVILDLHWAAPGRHLATGLLPLPDAEHAPDFWRSVASEFVDDRSILFDVFNEPHDVGWECWAAPCQVTDKWFGDYQATSLPELLAAIRSTGAQQPVMLGGLDWARDLRGWLDYRPVDPANALVAANHTYDFSLCDGACRKTLANIARHVPVVTAELGEGDCRHRYIDPYMRFADRHGISYLGWTWNTGGRWECGSGPSLIRDWEGHPTPYGKGLREHLRRLAKRGLGA
jgi:endoglucanase